MTPFALPFLRVGTLIPGGRKPPTEWKLESPRLLLPPPPRADAVSFRRNTAVRKVTAPRFSPTSGRAARTVTVSPGSNGLSGRKLAPLPSEGASGRPGGEPIRG